MIPGQEAPMGQDTSMLQDRWMIFDGLPLYFRTNALPVPPGARAIMHLHGFGISGTYLLPTAALLADRYATWVPDMPGFGRSVHPPRHLAIDDLADAAARFMDAQGIERAVLLGNSLGCPITLSFVEQHPDRIEAAVLVSPAGGPHNLPIWRGAAQLGLAGMREPLGMVPIGARDYLHYGIPQTIDLFRSMLHYPVARRLAQATLPTLVVIGSRDPLVDEARVKEISASLPHVTAVSIDGAAHAINFSHPGQLANVVSAFLEGRPITDDPSQPGRVRIITLPAAA
jgi:pimeloyl-ACP methyl ester carboxylesterase